MYLTAFLIIGGIIFLVLFFHYVPFFLWLSAKVSGVNISLVQLFLMRIRNVPPYIIVPGMIEAHKAGLQNITRDELEAHYLAGGHVERVVHALVSASKANIELPFQMATAIDLAGRDVFEAVQMSVNPKVIDLDSGTTVALAVTASAIGQIMATPCYAATLLPVNYQKKLVEQGKLEAATWVPVWGNIVKFLFRFIPTFICLYWGQSAIEMLVANSPQWLIDIMTIFGNPMPLIGFAILMKLLVKNPTDLIFFTVGFAFVGVLGVDMLTVLVFALLFALYEFKINRSRKGVQN